MSGLIVNRPVLNGDDEDTVRRSPGCVCQLEEGDSCCPIHCDSSCENGEDCERNK